MYETNLDNEAALAVLAAVSQWFLEGESDSVFDELNTKNPSSVIGVLFGVWCASIETICEMMDCPVEEYLAQVSLQLQRSMVGLDPHGD